MYACVHACVRERARALGEITKFFVVTAKRMPAILRGSQNVASTKTKQLSYRAMI